MCKVTEFVVMLQDRKLFEKVGEATEVALKVLVEKLNVQGLDRLRLSDKQRSCACYNVINGEFDKVMETLV